MDDLIWFNDEGFIEHINGNFSNFVLGSVCFYTHCTLKVLFTPDLN